MVIVVILQTISVCHNDWGVAEKFTEKFWTFISGVGYTVNFKKYIKKKLRFLKRPLITAFL